MAGGFEGVTAEPHQLDVSIDGIRVWSGTVQRPEGLRGDERSRKILEDMRFSAPITAGSHLVQVYFAAKTSVLRRGPVRSLSPPHPVSGRQRRAGRLQRDDHRSPSRHRRVRRLSQSRQAARVHPGLGGRPEDETACATTIISTLARRAYRRPVTDADLEVPLSLYRDGAARGGFEAGIELALRGILVSPSFLFRFEAEPETVASVHAVSDHRPRARLPPLVLPVEQHPGRRASRRGRPGHAEQPGGAATAGRADAGRPPLAGAHRQLRRPVAPRQERLRVPAEPGAAVPLRRQPPPRVRAGDQPVLREHHPGEPERPRSPGRGLHVI